jgi:hypothetical protein
MRMAGLPVKKRRGRGNGHQEKEIERWRSVPMEEAGRFSQTTPASAEVPSGEVSGKGSYEALGHRTSCVMWI